MGLSYSRTIIGAGEVGQTTFNITFTGPDKGYLIRNHIYLYINNVQTGGAGGVDPDGFTFITDNQVQLKTYSPVLNDIIEFRRIMPKGDAFINLVDGGGLTEVNLDQIHLGLLYVQHEAWDGYGEGAENLQAIIDAAQIAIDADVAAAAASAAAAALSETNSSASEVAAALSETNASTSETNAATSETNAAASETAAGISETNAGASETAAAISEGAASASETASALSETNAAASASSAASDQTDCSLFAANALASETNAAASEAAAALSETNAAASAASINLPALTAADPGKYLLVNPTYDGYVFDIPAAGDPYEYCDNGNFDHWPYPDFAGQTTSAYGSDARWENTHNISTKTHSRQEFSMGQTLVPGNPRYYSRTVFTTGGTAASFVRKNFKIPGADTLSGKGITLSFYARSPTSLSLAFDWQQHFGSGGTPSSSVLFEPNKIALTSGFLKYTYNIIVPSTSGLTRGTNGDDTLALNFWLEAGSDHNARTASLGNQSGTIDIARVSIFEGDFRLELDPLPYEESLVRCRRYFQKPDILYGFAVSSTDVAIQFRPTIEMRAAATATLRSSTPVIEDPPFVSNQTGSGSTVIQQHARADGGDVRIGGFTGLTPYQPVSLYDQLEFSAEL